MRSGFNDERDVAIWRQAADAPAMAGWERLS
jgi:hypothetical protein